MAKAKKKSPNGDIQSELVFMANAIIGGQLVTAFHEGCKRIAMNGFAAERKLYDDAQAAGKDLPDTVPLFLDAANDSMTTAMAQGILPSAWFAAVDEYIANTMAHYLGGEDLDPEMRPDYMAVMDVAVEAWAKEGIRARPDLIKTLEKDLVNHLAKRMVAEQSRLN